MECRAGEMRDGPKQAPSASLVARWERQFQSIGRGMEQGRLNAKVESIDLLGNLFDVAELGLGWCGLGWPAILMTNRIGIGPDAESSDRRFGG